MERILPIMLLCTCASSEPAKPPEVATVPTPSAPVAPPTRPAQTPREADACIVIDQDNLTGQTTTLEGVVECESHSHPNGSTYGFCFVQLDTPRCVKGMSEMESADQVQLSGDGDFSQVKGQRIRVHGDPFPQHTAWHARPVLISVKTFEVVK
jgi:hypothetical protein